MRTLFFECPYCNEWVKVRDTPDGLSLPDMLMKEQIEEIESIELTHDKCGLRLRIATVQKIPELIIEDEVED